MGASLDSLFGDIDPKKLQNVRNSWAQALQNAYEVRNEGLKHPRKDNYKSFNHGKIQVRIGQNDYDVDVVTAINTTNNEVFYDIVDIKPTKIGVVPTGGSLRSGTTPNNNLAQPAQTVNTQPMPNGSNNTQNSRPLDPNAITRNRDILAPF